MDHVVTKMSKGGRIVIPAEMRRELDLDIGDEVILLLKDRELVLMTREEALRRARRLVRRRVPADRLLSQELIEERRRESDS
ncbi:MAG: AbrB/MazE/SpoVT family DNA-binding domain-containing protein [Armatimonadetes bacterium]|nr:AbrB/MazE/SpoVT family DNA-binding domain-containing protein [Armatimonadota bacterium]